MSSALTQRGYIFFILISKFLNTSFLLYKFHQPFLYRTFFIWMRDLKRNKFDQPLLNWTYLLIWIRKYTLFSLYKFDHSFLYRAFLFNLLGLYTWFLFYFDKSFLYQGFFMIWIKRNLKHLGFFITNLTIPLSTGHFFLFELEKFKTFDFWFTKWNPFFTKHFFWFE